MTTNNNSFCLWDPKGNGHYVTGCGHLIYDYGRLCAVQNEDKRQSPKIFDICPKCKKKVKVE